jgi:hypothetical protein
MVVINFYYASYVKPIPNFLPPPLIHPCMHLTRGGISNSKNPNSEACMRSSPLFISNIQILLKPNQNHHHDLHSNLNSPWTKFTVAALSPLSPSVWKRECKL